MGECCSLPASVGGPRPGLPAPCLLLRSPQAGAAHVGSGSLAQPLSWELPPVPPAAVGRAERPPDRVPSAALMATQRRPFRSLILSTLNYLETCCFSHAELQRMASRGRSRQKGGCESFLGSCVSLKTLPSSLGILVPFTRAPTRPWEGVWDSFLGSFHFPSFISCCLTCHLHYD